VAWKKYLEREYACVLFKGNMQKQNLRLGTNKLFQNSLVKNPELASRIIDTQKAVGPEKLMELIKNYSKVDGIKSAVTVGVIGYPNVGKSSLINSLKKQRSAGVSGKAGFTRTLQVVEIDSKVKIIDSPGVILSNDDEVALVLRNQINSSEVKEPKAPIGEILKRSNKEKLLMMYRIADFNNPTQFLFNIAQSRGKFKKGGIVDIDASARLVIDDWNNGNMMHYLPPPGFDPSVMIGYGGMEVDVNSDNVNKTGSGVTLTEHDFGVAPGQGDGMDTEQVGGGFGNGRTSGGMDTE
jgi:nuclear GTP-binding protein